MTVFDFYDRMNGKFEIGIIGNFDCLTTSIVEHCCLSNLHPVSSRLHRLSCDPSIGWSSSFVLVFLDEKGKQHYPSAFLAPKSGISFKPAPSQDRKSTRLNSSHANISYAVFC